MDSIRTEDGALVTVGTLVFDYYNLRIARIVTEPDDQGWFYLDELYNKSQDGDRFETGPLRGGRGWTRELLNGERICSLEYAKRNRMYAKYVTDDEVALAEATFSI